MENNVIHMHPPYSCKCCGKFEIQEIHDICPICGWEDDEVQNFDPNFSGGANLLSLNDHRMLYKKHQNKDNVLSLNNIIYSIIDKLKNQSITFDEFILLLKAKFNMKFIYANTQYNIVFNDNCISFYQHEKKMHQLYKTSDEFIEKANINNVILRDVWPEIKKMRVFN